MKKPPLRKLTTPVTSKKRETAGVKSGSDEARSRAKAIAEICQLAGMGKEATADLIAGELTVDQARMQVLESKAVEAEKTKITSSIGSKILTPEEIDDFCSLVERRISEDPSKAEEYGPFIEYIDKLLDFSDALSRENSRLRNEIRTIVRNVNRRDDEAWAAYKEKRLSEVFKIMGWSEGKRRSKVDPVEFVLHYLSLASGIDYEWDEYSKSVFADVQEKHPPISKEEAIEVLKTFYDLQSFESTVKMLQRALHAVRQQHPDWTFPEGFLPDNWPR
jgi:hypothetical protein